MVWLLNGYLFLIKRQAQDRHLWVVLLNRRGASAARKAHNLEVTGSTPVAGISSVHIEFIALYGHRRHEDTKTKINPV
jgi:hypothetical protein